MSVSRIWHTATLVNAQVPGSPSESLPEVVVTGGWNAQGQIATTDVYDTATRTWRRAADLPVARLGDTATALADGRVLVTGGFSSAGQTLASTEVFQPLTGQWSAAASMTSPLFDHAAGLLADGRVLIAGG